MPAQETSPIEVYTCPNTDCEFNKEDRRWSVYADIVPVEVVDSYDDDGQLVSRETKEHNRATQKARARCPSCGGVGKQLGPAELRTIFTSEVGGFA